MSVHTGQLSIASGVELLAGAWYTFVSLVNDSFLFEVKSGPFDLGLLNEIAPWAPEEGGEQAQDYLIELRQRLQN